MDERFRGRPWQAAAALAVLAVGVAACSAPAIRGYQLQDVPEGFLFSANFDGGSSLLPDRELLSRGVWLGDTRTFEPQSQIQVTRYRGDASLEESQAARDVLASRYGNPASIDYGRVEPVTIDGRASFAWLETRYDENGAVRSLEYRAVIPYDSVTYTVEFNTSAADRLHPDSLTRVVHGWGRGETEVLWSAILPIAAALTAALFLLYWMKR